MNPKRLGFKVVDVHFGMFDYTLRVIVGPPENVQKYARWKFGDDSIEFPADAGMHRAMYFERKGIAPMVWLRRPPRTPEDYGTLAHEMTHAVRGLFKWTYLPLTDESEEAYTHAIGYAVRKVLEGLAPR